MFSFKFMENDANQLFRPLAYERTHHVFACDDCTAGVGFVCTPVSGWSTNMVATIELMLKDAYPVDSSLSFSLLGSPDIQSVLTHSDALRRDTTDPLMRQTHDGVMGHLWGGTEHPVEQVQGTKARHFELLVTLKTPVKNEDLTPADVSQMASLGQTLKSRLQKAGFFPRELTAEGWLQRINVFLHWKKNAQWRKGDLDVDKYQPLNKQCLQTDTSVVERRDGVLLGKKGKYTHAKLLTLRNLPKKPVHVGTAFTWFADPFQGSGCVTQPFIITLNLVYPDSAKTKEGMQYKKDIYVKQSFGAITQFVPKIKEMREDLEILTNEFERDGKPVKASLSAAVFGSYDEDGLQTQGSAAKSAADLQTYMAMSGFGMVEEDHFAIPSLINLLPFGCDAQAVKLSQRYFTLSSRQATPLLPVFADWPGTGTPVMLLVSRTGQVMAFDLFDSKTNYNTLIYAESGSGKSFFANELIRCYLSTDARIWAIDAGESYKKLTMCANGNFIQFDENEGLGLQTFSMIDPNMSPKDINENIELLARLIMIMAYRFEPKADKDIELKYAALELILHKVWREKSVNGTLDDVWQKCQASEDQRMNDLGVQLEAFCVKYGYHFDKGKPVHFKGQLNVLELDGLSDKPQLQATVLYMMLIQIGREMYEQYKQDRSIRRLVLIDEAWDLLGNSPVVTDFIERGFRRFRKYNGAGIIITQSIMDLQKSAAGKAIAENAANSLILNQQEKTLVEAQKNNLMSLPEAGYKLLRHVTTEAGHYSEIFLKTNAGMGIGRLIVDPYRAMMFSTKAADNARLDTHLKAGAPLEKALEAVVKEDDSLRYPLDRPAFLDNTARFIKNQMEVAHFMRPMDEKDEKKEEALSE